jgi:DNA replication and repair protein RecF
MSLARLEITAVRNLHAVSLQTLEQTNILFGDNGSGKTSVLESIFLLGMARSFRSNKLKSIITHGRERCTVFGEVVQVSGASQPLGVTRDLQGGFQAKIGGANLRSSSELAEQLPLQIVNAESFNLLLGSPGHRRQFLDWGVFHVEHQFHSIWQRFQRVLKQRNTLLRHGKITDVELRTWDRELCEAGSAVDEQRKRYFEDFEPLFHRLVPRLSPDLRGVELRYRRGWDKTMSLQEALESCAKTDREQGFTHVGPQRADVRVFFEGHAASEILSRGQQKLVVCALKLAQGQLMSQRKGRSCLYLVDDLPAELDRQHCRRVAEILMEIDTQVYITCIDTKELVNDWPEEWLANSAMFHVEHGEVSRK